MTEEGAVTIKVKTVKESAVEFSVTPATTTVGQLKTLIEQSTLQVPTAAQRLIYQGKMLKDESKDLASFGVGEGSCLLLSDVSKALGAAAPTTTTTTLPTAATAATTATAALPPAPAVAPAAVPVAPPAGLLPAHIVILRAAIQGVKSSNTPEAATTALRTIQTIIANVVGNPHEAKYRQVKKRNAAFDRRVGSVPGTGAILRAAGFADSGETWDLTPSEQGWNVICSAKTELDAAIAALPPPPASSAPMPGAGGLMGGGAGGMPAMSGMPGLPGMGGDMAQMMGMMQQMQNNPGMREQVLSQLRAVRPDMAGQFEAIMANPGMLQGAMQAMQQNPALAQQAMAMAGQQAGGGVQPAMPGFGAPAMPLGGQLAPPQQQQGGQPQAQQQQDDAGMTEEEMLQEAINRSLREM